MGDVNWLRKKVFFLFLKLDEVPKNAPQFEHFRIINNLERMPKFHYHWYGCCINSLPLQLLINWIFFIATFYVCSDMDYETEIAIVSKIFSFS